MIEDVIRSKLLTQFSSQTVTVENESHKHSVPKHSETHFKIVIVSDDFKGQNLLARHRKINEILKEEIAQIRAMSLHTFTHSEWDNSAQNPESPQCAGGSKRN